MNIWNIFLKLIKPLVIFFGQLRAPFSKKKINGDHYYMWRDSIDPGSVLLSSTYGEFSNLLNPSSIGHGALYSGGPVIKCVTEAVGIGVVKNNLVKFMTTKDVFILIKPTFATKEQMKIVADQVEKYIGSHYDFIFESGNNDFYCFELIIRAYNDIFPEKQFRCKEVVKGKKIYDADTFLKDPENWVIEIDSRNLDKE